MVDRVLHPIGRSAVADINITYDFPKFNMIDNVDTVIKKLEGRQDARHPKGKEKFLKDGIYAPDILDSIEQKYLISTYLGWPKHSDSE